MIATHTPKLTNARTQQDAICSDIVGDIDKRLICSKNIFMEKKYWVAPRNSADMKKWKEAINNVSFYPLYSLPDIQDGRNVKQVLVPTDNWMYDESDSYIAVSPIESMGVLNELNRRLDKSVTNKYKLTTIQVTPQALPNHGEYLMSTRGKLPILLRGVTETVGYQSVENSTKTNCVALTFNVQDCNIGAGFFCVGHPAITAIGGLVHSIERNLNTNIDFAVGLYSTQPRGQKRYSRLNAKKEAVWGLTTELTGNAEIVLLLRSKDLELLYKYMVANPIHRVAGGSVWDYQVEYILDGTPPPANYLINATDDMDVSFTSFDDDALAEALYFHGLEKPIYSINQTGYAFLEYPKPDRAIARKGYPHAWAEPIYSLIRQDVFSDKAFWQRDTFNTHLVWF